MRLSVAFCYAQVGYYFLTAALCAAVVDDTGAGVILEHFSAGIPSSSLTQIVNAVVPTLTGQAGGGA